MTESFCEVDTGVTLCYETFGEASDPPVLLIMGLGTQMIGWEEGFCRMLAESGHFVIRFDNRDVGLSSETDVRPPKLRQLVTRRLGGDQYTLADMADDTAGLMDAVGLDSAHLVGASMGGMIAQTVATRCPERVRSLVSIMSSTGSRRVGQPSLPIYRHFLRPLPREREAQVAHMARFFELVGSRRELRDPERTRALIERSLDRSVRPLAGARQLGAILASGDRTGELRSVAVPATVIHGSADRLVSPSGGRATAEAIPDARLMMVEAMGHDLPRPLWPKLVDAIGQTARRGDSLSAATPASS